MKIKPEFYRLLVCCVFIYIIGQSVAFCQDYEQVDQSDEINLALRQTGHLLYEFCGDTFSQIPPVEQTSGSEFKLKLENGFDYDKLPEILESSLKSFGVTNSYIVSILTCESESIVLGYNNLSIQNQVVACRSREQDELCKIIMLNIQKQEPVESKVDYSMFWLFLFGVIPLLVFYINRRKIEAPESAPLFEKLKNNYLTVGGSTFDPSGLVFSYKDESKPLTFREGKLFEYFINHKNEVLKREDIQNHVWQDEGVIVGRSLDVFISRLRKIIKDDTSLAIKNIHGVGYRLEARSLEATTFID
ncbi:MAG: DNA-binding winged helix-turn-helix (wHTH) protein [Halioglobus sp.]|jgi:DNA-binding winged helix-turn-helix (wHTH) protein